MTAEEIIPKQIKNKYQSLKRDWQAWQLLADARRGATGLGYNLVTGTFTAPPHFWTNLIAVKTFSKLEAFTLTLFSSIRISLHFDFKLNT